MTLRSPKTPLTEGATTAEGRGRYRCFLRLTRERSFRGSVSSLQLASMALVSISTDFTRPLRVLVVLAVLVYIFLYFPGSSPTEVLSSAPWIRPLRRPIAATYGVDPLERIDPLIGTINGGEAADPRRDCILVTLS